MDNFEILLEKITQNDLTYLSLLKIYLNNIESLNPSINGINLLNENAIEEAKNCDKLKNEGISLGILHGLPVLIKDTIETQNLVTTAGSLQFKDYVPLHDAEVVKRLKNAGAIIIGKSNTSDTMFSDIQTFNQLFGVTNNPWNINKTPGGSSGGSTAAVASGMVPLALGSDLLGSLRIPTSFCGIVSLRPTEGRIPIQGHIPPIPGNPISTSEITIGPIAKTTMGLEILMQALCGESINREYPETPYNPLPSPSNSDIRIAITTDFSSFPTDNKILEVMSKIPGKLKDNGIEANIDSVDLPLRSIQMAHKIFSQQIFESRSLDETFKIDPNDKSPQSSLVLAAIKIRDQCRILVDEFLDKYSAWIVPVTSVLPFDHNPNHDKISINGGLVHYWKATISYSTPFSLIGNPVVTLPVEIVDGLPVGVQIIGKRWQDEYLMAISRVLENVFGQFDPPEL